MCTYMCTDKRRKMCRESTDSTENINKRMHKIYSRDFGVALGPGPRFCKKNWKKQMTWKNERPGKHRLGKMFSTSTIASDPDSDSV